eukprot:CAMPEP_0198524538 /NCGR_PEP_ID=MMETSP1462-20131121/22809_1 /TAXON_ID=1333877 /ORGANISM="Brandtodinium nutriculum, Strain RCC3387" /LENGTH=79 /DNA_ID=CAMNT_0044254269 /DNA_START=33 /DNA_END=273 /DNA_ORIENTATION=+
MKGDDGPHGGPPDEDAFALEVQEEVYHVSSSTAFLASCAAACIDPRPDPRLAFSSSHALLPVEVFSLHASSIDVVERLI